ncbi:hypothetical protein BC833DRAFT_511388, partial [Globomyces pollinis-pini]
NPGSNLFVTGLATRVRESELEELFGKYGKVTFMDFSNLRWKKFKSCTPTLSDLRRDPHSEDSRGFGFIKFSTDTDANAALALDGCEFMEKTLIVQKAKRSRARTPTPGQYRGPIK